MTRTYYNPNDGASLLFERELGRGQFGIAKAVRNRRGVTFCLKQVSFQLSDQHAKNEVLREVSNMKETFEHPNIITFYDSWFEKGRLSILMEYCSNGSLDKVIERFYNTDRHFTHQKIIHYMQELAGALSYCHHNLRIMHRDLKPANVLIDEIGTLKLADFGLSKCLDTASDMCATFCGSPLYMSPEQLSGKEYSFTSDVWALGCIAFELMALRSPWTRSRDTRCSYPALMSRIKEADPDYTSLARRYPDRLIGLTKWMLQTSPIKRCCAADISDHLEMRAPPCPKRSFCVQPGEVVLLDAIVSPPVVPCLEVNTTLERRNQIVEDAKQLAVMQIQRSFRSSVLCNRRKDKQAVYQEPTRPQLFERKNPVAQKEHALYRPNVHQPISNVRVPGMDRINQLAVPRGVVPRTGRIHAQPPLRRASPQLNMLPSARGRIQPHTPQLPRPAWL
jgi:NIMA (never in mitosis gene a)-related kinase